MRQSGHLRLINDITHFGSIPQKGFGRDVLGKVGDKGSRKAVFGKEQRPRMQKHSTWIKERADQSAPELEASRITPLTLWFKEFDLFANRFPLGGTRDSLVKQHGR